MMGDAVEFMGISSEAKQIKYWSCSQSTIFRYE